MCKQIQEYIGFKKMLEKEAEMKSDLSRKKRNLE